MERKILISNVNYDSKIAYNYLDFREKAKEILFTGKKNSEEAEESIKLEFRTNNLFIERVKTDEIKGEIEELDEDKIKIKIYDLNSKRTFITINGLAEIEGQKIKGFLNVGTFLESLKLEDFERVELEYFNLFPKKAKELKLNHGEFFIVKSRKGNDKLAIIDKVLINDVKNVNLKSLKLMKIKDFDVTNVEKLKINLETLKNLKKGKSFIKTYILSLAIYEEEDLKVLFEKAKEDIIEAKILEFEEVEGRDTQIDFEKFVEGKISISDILKIRNIERRRMIASVFGGLKELIKNEKETELIEKTDKGELWRVKVDNEEVKFLKYKDISTEREYISFVPPNIHSVEEGFAWKFNLKKEEYQSLTAES